MRSGDGNMTIIPGREERHSYNSRMFRVAEMEKNIFVEEEFNSK